MAVSRRELLIASSGAVIAAASAVGIYTFWPHDRELTADRLVQTLDHPQAAAEIGAALLSSRADPQAETFRAALAAKLMAQGVGPDASTQTIKDAMTQLIRWDFAEGNLVDIEGWMLARSEAELCALAALSLGHI